MISFRVFTRLIHIQTPCLAAEKSLLATLRKKTGYTFSNCKKALEMHNNDVAQAEKWLKQQAQALGWSKATKLEGRQTTQGLIGVLVSQEDAALVEVNCETDFVARTKEFQDFVGEAATGCLSFAQSQSQSSNLTKIPVSSEQLKNLEGAEGKTLADQLALMIGKVGENASLKRGFCMKSGGGVHISGYAHPSGTSVGNVLVGKLGGLVALKSRTGNSGDIEKIGKELCQHIVGMNPRKIGDSQDKPAEKKDDETCLIHQEFLLDDGITVGEILEENGLEIIDFQRFECGENLHPEKILGKQSLEHVETCQ